MQPEVERLLEIRQNVEQATNTPSQNDQTFRAMLHELKHQEEVERFIREQVGNVPHLASSLDEHINTLTNELSQARARIADLEAKNAALTTTTMQQQPEPILLEITKDGLEYPDDAISGRDQIIGKYPHPIREDMNNAG